MVYDSILTKRKKGLHEDIGNAIEELYKDNLHEHYGVLANHYITSENYEKGDEYSRLAGKKAEKTASLNDAIVYAKKRVASLERLLQTDDVQKKLIDARTALGLYFVQMNYPVEAKEAIDPIIRLASKAGYRRRLSQIYGITGIYNCFVEEDFPKAFKDLEDALKISEEANDIVSLYFEGYWFGVAPSLICEFEKCFTISKEHLILMWLQTIFGVYQ